MANLLGIGKPDSKPTFPYFLWYLFEILAILSYGIRVDRSRHQHIYLFLVIASAIVYCLCFTWIDGEIMQQKAANTSWGMGCRLSGILLYLSANFVLTDPLRDIKLVKEGKKDKADEVGKVSLDMYDKPLLSRLWWGVVVAGNPRGVNFQYAGSERPKSMVRPTHTSRLSFIISQIRSFAFLFILYDLSDTVNLLNPNYTSTEPSPDELAIFGSYVLGRLVWPVANLAYGTSIWFILDMEYIIFSIFGVATGISKPRDWPDMFGSLSDAWTLRGFWGKMWHQIFRRPSIVLANFFLRILGFPMYRSASSKSQRQFICTFILFAVFFITGLIHYVGDAVWMQNVNIFDKNGPGAMHFYMLQPVGITLEDLVISLLGGSQDRTSPSTKTKALGYIWVITWISLTLPLWTYPQYRHGFKNDMPHPMIVLQLLGLSKEL